MRRKFNQVPTSEKETCMYEIIHDGGALNNQNAEKRQAYGSMAARFNGKPVEMTVDAKKTSHFFMSFGTDTNNAAEYKAMIVALTYAVQFVGRLNDEQIKQIGKVVFRTDSELVVRQMSGESKIKSASLKPLWEQAQALFSIYPEIFEIQWIDNLDVKKILGH
jgi:ribonuclease HI